jgi:hypothetical protein
MAFPSACPENGYARSLPLLRLCHISEHNGISLQQDVYLALCCDP